MMGSSEDIFKVEARVFQPKDGLQDEPWKVSFGTRGLDLAAASLGSPRQSCVNRLLETSFRCPEPPVIETFGELIVCARRRGLGKGSMMILIVLSSLLVLTIET